MVDLSLFTLVSLFVLCVGKISLSWAFEEILRLEVFSSGSPERMLCATLV